MEEKKPGINMDILVIRNNKWEWFEKDSLPDNLFPATKNLIDCYLQKKVSVVEQFTD